MKLTQYVVLASLAMLASCSNEDNNVPVVNKPQDVAIHLSIGQSRAPMGAMQDAVASDAAASVTKVHVYLTKADGTITASKEFTPGNDEYTKLTSATALGQNVKDAGYKFLDVDAQTTKATVVVNPAGVLGAKDTKIEAIANFTLKAQVGEVIYADTKELATAGSEPWGVSPQEDGRVVKTAEFELTANMNRFQILGMKFVKVAWKEGQKAVAETWVKEYLAKEANKGQTEAQAWDAFKAATDGLNGEVYAATKKAEALTNWSKFFEVKDVTGDVETIMMNRFYNEFQLSTKASAGELLHAKTVADGKYENGTFKPDGTTDVSAAAVYYKADGGLIIDAGKAAAFNFFSDKVTSYAVAGDAPLLHIILKKGAVADTNRFYNIKGYATDEAGATALDAAANKGGKLINIDLSKLNGGNGVHIGNDPDVPAGVTETPGDGGDDLSSENANVIVRATVMSWNAG